MWLGLNTTAGHSVVIVGAAAGTFGNYTPS